MDQSHTIDTLNELLRGEIAATETYQQAINECKDGPGASQLRQLHVEHREAANELRKHVHEHGGQPDRTSGAWGQFASIIEGGATLFGDKAAMKALKEGEEHGINAYEKAIKDPELPADCRRFISTQLLPQTRTHVQIIDSLMNMSS